MRKKLTVVLRLAVAFVILGVMSCGTVSASEQTEAVNVGNTVCPVSGDKIDEKVKATYTYEGKTYNFCCAMCIDSFKKDPQEYIKKIV